MVIGRPELCYMQRKDTDKDNVRFDLEKELKQLREELMVEDYTIKE